MRFAFSEKDRVLNLATRFGREAANWTGTPDCVPQKILQKQSLINAIRTNYVPCRRLPDGPDP